MSAVVCSDTIAARLGLKSAALTRMAVVVKTADLDALADELAQRVDVMPGLFDEEPVAVDLCAVRDAEQALDVDAMLALLRRYRMRPVAARSGDAAQRRAADAAGLLEAPEGAQPPAREIAPPPPPEVIERFVEVQLAPLPPLVVDKPLRSGQQVYARDRDLIVLALVSFGAEVVADGRIHLYAPMRGRAHAGAAGNTEARIFCHGLEAQVLVIAGVYRAMDGPLPEGVVGGAAGRRRARDRAPGLNPETTNDNPEDLLPMATKIIVVTSGKGGVGKTTTSASFASGLALREHKTAVIDFDVGLRNLDLIMGCERRVVYDLINVIHDEAKLSQALIKDKHSDNLVVLAASQTRDKEALTKEGVKRVLDELAEMGMEYIVCDSPAGIETGALLAMHYADEAIVVTNPEVSSVRDSDRILGMLSSKTQRANDGKDSVREHLLITRYDPARVASGQMLSVDDIHDILRTPLIGVIPESESVLNASNQGVPAIHLSNSAVAEAYKDVVRRFLGEAREMRFTKPEQAPTFFQRLFARPSRA